MTVKTKITLFIVGAGLVSSLLFSVVVFYELIEQPFDLLDSALRNEAHRATRIVVQNQRGSPSARPLDPAFYALDPQYWIEVYESDTHKMIFQSALAKSITLSPVKPDAKATVKATVSPNQINPGPVESRETTYRVRTFSIESGGRSFVVQIALAMAELENEIRELVFGIIAGLSLSTMALIVISRFVAGKILQPIGRMKDLAQDISEKNLDRRIPTGEGRDELSELSRTINRMLDRLQYSFKRQRDFLFDTSHELKTPLTTMRLAIDEICAHDPQALPSATGENLSRLKNQVLRMERLVRDLLNLSSLEALAGIDGKQVHLTELLSSLAEEYRFLADAHHIQMDVRLPEQLIIQGDAEKLRRAFSNILDNAVKYNVDGGRIELTGDRSGTEVKVTVANTGPGIAEAEVAKVFDQFYRAEKSRSIQHGGSGLGLAIVKRTVELHGGTATFESRMGGWTRVTVLLPRERATAAV